MSLDAWKVLSQAIESRREMAVHLIQELVRRPSIGDESQVQQYIAAWWRERNIVPDSWEPDIEELRKMRGFVEVDYDYSGRPNQVVFIKGAGGGHSLTLNGHTDVVPVEPAPWTHGDPWGGQYVDGRVYGRGSIDMKGGLALGMIVLDALLENGIRLKGDLQMQFVVDEENGGNGTLAAIQRGYRSDGTIFLEPNDPGVMFVSSRGAHFFRVTVPGIEAGIEYQFSTPNCIEKAFFIFKKIQDYALWRNSQADHPLYEWDPTKIPATACKIQAGSWPSTLASQCVLEGSIECLPGEDIDLVTNQFRKYLLMAANQDAWLKENPPVIEFFGLRYESGETNGTDPFITTLVNTYRAVTSKDLVVRGGGGTDLRLPLLYAGSPSVIIGPTGGSFHATDEYVDIDSVMQVAQVLGKFILDWCEAVQP